VTSDRVVPVGAQEHCRLYQIDPCFSFNADFRSPFATDIFCPAQQSSVVEFNTVALEPGNRARRFVESRFAKNGVVAATVEQDS
jgi:hypothetical protein